MRRMFLSAVSIATIHALVATSAAAQGGVTEGTVLHYTSMPMVRVLNLEPIDNGKGRQFKKGDSCVPAPSPVGHLVVRSVAAEVIEEEPGKTSTTHHAIVLHVSGKDASGGTCPTGVLLGGSLQEFLSRDYDYRAAIREKFEKCLQEPKTQGCGG